MKEATGKMGIVKYASLSIHSMITLNQIERTWEHLVNGEYVYTPEIG